MSTTTLNDDWVQCQSANALANDVITWTTSISRSQISTADGLGLSENLDSGSMNSLESLLRIVQQLKLKRLRAEEIEQIRFVAAGETFLVSQCSHEGTVVAIKRIRLNEKEKDSDRQHFQRRLQSVLREILILCHPPIAHHPNIIDILGYGWSMQMQRVSPFISLEFASGGSLRDYMKESGRSIKTKLILIGDVGAGLMALHRCGIVHGDLKADNVVVFSSLDRPSMSIAKVSDFGHSILMSSATEEKSKYTGTVLYNAPEVANQRNQPIPIEQLHKCDIWAFGLCVWEILADGEIYFKRSWRTNPVYQPPPLYASPTSPTDKTHEEPSIEEDSDNVLGHFDLHHTKTLALEFLESMRISGIGFEKGFLRPLLNGALHTDPAQRISDLSCTPIIGFWNRVSGSHSLQSKLAIYTLSGDIRYSIFSKDGGPYIIWEQQQQLLQDFEAVAQQNESQKNDRSAMFQTMLCYVNSFGTSMNLSKARQFLHAAEETNHLLARILGARLRNGFSNDNNHTNSMREYNACLALGFKTVGRDEKVATFSVHNGESVTEFADFSTLRDAFAHERASIEIDQDDLEKILISRSGSSKKQNILEIAIQQGDSDLVSRLLPVFRSKPKEMETRGHLLVQAARYGHGDIVNRLLQEGVPVTCDGSSSCLLHWLFCLDANHLSKVQQHLQTANHRNDIGLVINRAIKENTPLHPQWPFQIHGTPLATAIAAGSIAAVKVLLALKADPTAAAFVNTDDDGDRAILTPIHLAISYHFPEMVKILWYAAFKEKKITINRVYTARALGRFPIACSLSLSTNAERFAIHGSRHRQSLQDTIELLPLGAFTQTSPEGKDAVTQAIDLEDVEAVELIFQRHPELAARRLSQPGTSKMFTYPLHFAVQVGSLRDTEESAHILSLIIKLDPTAINKPDSSSVKPVHIAAMGTSDRMLNILLRHGATCNDIDDRGQTPLFFCRSANVAKTLLSKGADPNHKDQLGFTPVHTAATQGAEEVLQALIDTGANLGYTDNGIGSPLHCAVKRKSLSMVEMLLKASVNVDARDAHGRTPLLVAMDTGRSDLVSILFENGADPLAEDSHGSSPLRLALAWPNASILGKFQIGKKLDTLPWSTKIAVLHFAAESSEPEALKLFLLKAFGTSSSEESPIFLYSREVEVAIHKATLACRADLVEALLAYGLKVNAKDTKGNTALLLGCQIGRERPDFDQYTRTHICEILIDYGANIQEKNDLGLTPFSIAQAHADYHLMTLFLDHALRLSDLEPRSRILDSIKYTAKDKEHIQESRALIGDEIIDLQLLRQATTKGEWDFFMSCIGGNFVGKEDLLQIFPREAWLSGVDSLDILRFHCARRDREIVRYLHERGHSETTFKFEYTYPGTRNLQVECSECRISLNATLWPEKTAKLSDTGGDNKARRRKLSIRSEKRSQEPKCKDTEKQEKKWGWRSDRLTDDPISSDEESNPDEQHEASGAAEQANDMDMTTEDPEEKQSQNLEKKESQH